MNNLLTFAQGDKFVQSISYFEFFSSEAILTGSINFQPSLRNSLLFYLVTSP
jgi:hypothetical protein